MAVACTRNLTVIARNAADGFYYSGFITNSITGSEEVRRVVFHNIKPQDVPVNHVINIGGAVPWPELKLWDYVLVRVRCKTNGIECYVPGRVTHLPIDFRHENRFYTLELYTRSMTNKTRRYIIKIGKEKYLDIVEYIMNVRHQHAIKFFSEPNLTSRRLLGRRVKKKSFWGKRSAFSSQHMRCTHHHHHYYEPPKPRPARFVTSSRTSSASRRLSNLSFEEHTRRSTMSSETVSSGRSNGSRTSKDSTDRPSKKKPRTALLKPGDDVLARWQDDGWYYFGKVAAQEEDGFVRVLDSTGYEERIKREDILVSNEREVIQQYEKIIALHPRYVYSYAPATVLNASQSGYRVQFYDDTERRLPRSEVYKISHMKFKKDVEYIEQQERNLSGPVIARDDTSGIYKPCTAECPDYQTQKVFLQLPNNTYKKQSFIHVFPLDAQQQKYDRTWEFVIGPLDQARTVYLPANIICRRPFRLMFCNGMQSEDAQLSQCFYVSEDYYRNATNYFWSNVSHT